MKQIIMGMCILLLMATSGYSLVNQSQGAKTGIILKLQSSQSTDDKAMALSVALSFTNPTGKPSFQGVRILTYPLLPNGQRNLVGFRNGDGVSQFKHPTQDVILKNETYTYVLADADRQENGMFSLYPMRSDPISYALKGVFFAQGHVFVIDEILHINEEKICYSKNHLDKP